MRGDRRRLDGREVVDADGRSWRAFAPGWRLWRWLGYLRRRVVVALLPGRLMPLVGWSPARRIDAVVGMPPRRVALRCERVEGEASRVARARFASRRRGSKIRA